MVGGLSPQGIVSDQLQCLAFEAEPLAAGGLFHKIFVVQAVQVVTQPGKGRRGPSRAVAGDPAPIQSGAGAVPRSGSSGCQHLWAAGSARKTWRCGLL